MKVPLNFYPFHLGDYASATRHLSWDEDAAYRRLLDAYYVSEAPLPPELRKIYRLVSATTEEQRESVETVLREFFIETPSGWNHSRCDAEIERFRDKSEKAAAAGRASFRSRVERESQKQNNTRSTDVDVTDNERSETDDKRSTTNTNTNTNTRTKTRTNTNTKEAKSEEPRARTLKTSDLIAEGVHEQAAVDFMQGRKSAGKPLTMTAWTRLKDAAASVGLSIDEAVTYAAGESWQTFHPTYWRERTQGKANGQHASLVEINGKRMTKHGAATASAGDEWLAQQDDLERTIENEH